MIGRLIVLLFLILPIGSVFSAPKRCDLYLKVSVAKDWPPYSWESSPGEYRGIDIDFIETVLADLGYCPTYIAYPSSSRAFAEFQKGNVDLIFGASFSNVRAKWSVFSKPYRKEEIKFISLDDTDTGSWPRENLTMVLNRGSFYGDIINAFRDRCITCIYEANEAIDRLIMVSKKRVQVALEDRLTANYLIEKNGLSELIISEETVHFNDVYFMLRPDALSYEQLKRLDDAILKTRLKLDSEAVQHYQ
jgi:polar amino acid transport system substrate-binding protein